MEEPRGLRADPPAAIRLKDGPIRLTEVDGSVRIFADGTATEVEDEVVASAPGLDATILLPYPGLYGDLIEDEHIERNPARGSRMRIKAPKPARTFLEMDELVALIDAAGEQDGPLVTAVDASSEQVDGTRAEVARAVTQGMRAKGHRRCAGALQGYGRLPPGPPGRRAAARVSGSSRDLRNAGAQRYPLVA